MKKKILFGLGSLALITALTFNVSLTKKDSNVNSSLGLLVTDAFAQSEDIQPMRNMQETTATKKIITYYKFDVDAKIWKIVTVAAEAQRTEETSYTYKCCVSGAGTCNIGVPC